MLPRELVDRAKAKAVNFGVIYGQTAFGLARQLGIPRGKAGSYIKAYLAKLPGVTQYMDELVELDELIEPPPMPPIPELVDPDELTEDPPVPELEELDDMPPAPPWPPVPP